MFSELKINLTFIVWCSLPWVPEDFFFVIDTDGSRRSRVNEAQSAEEKERVRLKMGNNFDKQVFDSLVDEIVKTNMPLTPLCLKSLKEVEEKVLIQHPPTF